MSGSEEEPAVPLPEQAAEQMRDATDRLREQGWMVAPLTQPVLPEQPDRFDSEELGGASSADA